MTIKALATTQPVMASEDASIEEAANLLKQENVGSIVIVKNKSSDLTPKGILTDRDIIIHLLAANKVDSSKVRVGDIMSTELLTLKEGQGIREAIAAMCQKGVRRAPIVNNENKVVGLVSLDDILILLSEELKEVAEVIRKQVGK